MRTAVSLPLADRIVRLATQTGAVAILAAGFTMSSATSSYAIFNAEQTQHIIECARWLLTDPETHAENCLPSRVAVPFRSLSEPVTSYIAPPPVVIVTPPEEEKPPHEEPCKHEDTYYSITSEGPRECGCNHNNYPNPS
jgi:hypothetical protein